MPVWAVAIAVVAVRPPSFWPLSFVLSPYNLDFIMGVGVAVLLRLHTVPRPYILSVTGMFLFALLLFAAPASQDTGILSQVGFGSASALFVLGTVEAERERPIALPRIFVLLGAASYAIYLIHPVALSFSALAIARLPFRLSTEGAALCGIAIGIVSGIAYHRLIEKPLTALARRVLPHRMSKSDETTGAAERGLVNDLRDHSENTESVGRRAAGPRTI